MSLFGKLRELDAYTKPMEDFRVKTMTGGLVTMIATVLIAILAISETSQFMKHQVVEQLFVDSTTSDVRVELIFDLTFHRLPCSFVTIDVMDVSSDNQDNIQHNIFKVQLDSMGNNITETVVKQEVNTNKTSEVATESTTTKCGSCYGALPAGSCCNTCEEVKEAYHIKGWQANVEEIEQCKGDEWVKLYSDHKGEGCRVYGKVEVAKVAGNFHIAPGDPFRAMRSHVHDLHSMDPGRFDTGHTIHHFSFGSPYPGKHYPLDGKRFDTEKGGMMYNYYVKVVPTSYIYMNGQENDSHQFSITTHQKELGSGVSGLPGFFVQYEFSPLMVQYEERRTPFISFLVSLCAIIGGVFTVAQLLDTFLYHSSRVLEKKLSINKLG